jgi:hypothetical protein
MAHWGIAEKSASYSTVLAPADICAILHCTLRSGVPSKVFRIDGRSYLTKHRYEWKKVLMWKWIPLIVSTLLGTTAGLWWGYHQQRGTMSTIKWMAIGALFGVAMTLLGPMGPVLLRP